MLKATAHPQKTNADLLYDPTPKGDPKEPSLLCVDMSILHPPGDAES